MELSKKRSRTEMEDNNSNSRATTPLLKTRQVAIKKQDPITIDQVWVHGGCPDGMGAATVAYLYGQTQEDEKTFEFKYLFHGSAMPSGKDKHIVIFDFCPKKEELEVLLQECKSIGIYDHHKSAFPVMDDFPEICTYDNDHSGVGLAWSFFFPEYTKPPLWVSYIEDRDLWRFKYGEKTKQLAAFLYYNGHEMNPESWFYALYKESLEDAGLEFSSFVKDVTDNDFIWTLEDSDEILEKGAAMLKVQDSIVSRRSKYVKKATFCGIPCAVSNDNEFVSEICNAILEKHQDIKLVLSWRMDHINDSYCFSMRSREKDKEISCGVICAKFGGGGHDQAAAFKLPGIDTNLVEFLAKNL